MRWLARLCCGIAVLGVTACGDAIRCPGELVDDGLGGCRCPDGVVARSTPVTTLRGGGDYCFEPEVPTGRDAPDAGHAGPASSDPPVGLDSSTNLPRPTPEARSDASAAAPAPPSTCVATPEVCDEADNDCDGQIDESLSCAPAAPSDGCTPTTWYRDCDGDGYAINRSGAAMSCSMPKPPADCRGWTRTEPTTGSIDCNDDSIAYAPGADFGAAGVGDGDLNCDGIIERRVEAVSAPSIVERKPREDAQFCRYGAEQRRLDCECFHWDPNLWQGEAQPPCAGALSERIEAAYVAFEGTSESRRCGLAVTLATMSIDSYQLRQLCR